METGIMKAQNLAETLEDLQIRFDEIDKRKLGSVLRERDAIDAKTTSNVHDFLAAHPVGVQGVVPTSMRETGSSSDLLACPLPQINEGLVRQR
jgi:hypothetical protein